MPGPSRGRSACAGAVWRARGVRGSGGEGAQSGRADEYSWANRMTVPMSCSWGVGLPEKRPRAETARMTRADCLGSADGRERSARLTDSLPCPWRSARWARSVRTKWAQELSQGKGLGSGSLQAHQRTDAVASDSPARCVGRAGASNGCPRDVGRSHGTSMRS